MARIDLERLYATWATFLVHLRLEQRTRSRLPGHVGAASEGLVEAGRTSIQCRPTSEARGVASRRKRPLAPRSKSGEASHCTQSTQPKKRLGFCRQVFASPPDRKRRRIDPGRRLEKGTMRFVRQTERTAEQRHDDDGTSVCSRKRCSKWRNEKRERRTS